VVANGRAVQSGWLMNLVLLDVDGTLTQTYEYDREVFALAIAEVARVPSFEVDFSSYTHITSLGVTTEAIQRITGRSLVAEEIEEVKRSVLRYMQKMYLESPTAFREVPGASCFLERLRSLDRTGTAIATGGWLGEALFKLRASRLSIDGIPLATSDDDRDRRRIMEIAVQRAQDFYACPKFEHIVYLGDGPWDLQAALSLGYAFVGIGTRLQALKDAGANRLHRDYLDLEAVFASVAAALR
jgi:phosphoglycolate phosphatase-like HAD superfamily hydrolase